MPDDDKPDDDKPDGGSPGDGTPGSGGLPRPPRPQSPPPAPSQPPPARLADLVIPLSTLLGLAQRPGEGHGLGPLDPALCHSLAAAAASSPHTIICVTVTAPDGTAIGHGCARPGRRSRRGLPRHVSNASHTSHPAPGRPLAALPSRLNLTIPASRLPELARPPDEARPGPAPWSLPRPRRGAARRLRELAPHPARRPGPHRAPGTRPDHRMRPPPPHARLSARRHPAPPGPGPRLHVHLPDLLPPRPRQRLRPRHPLRPRRPQLRVQCRRPQPCLPPGQTNQRLAPHPAPSRLAPVDNPAGRTYTQGPKQYPD